MRQGFTIIEVLIATAIASLLTVALFFSFDRINNGVRRLGELIDIFNTATLVDHVFFKDISGAFIPVQAIPPKKEQKKAEPGKPDQKEKKDEKKNPEEKKAAEQETKPEGGEQSKVPILKDPFVSKNAGNQLSMLSFITANPMRVYVGEKTGEPKPNCVRVVYTLQEKKDKTKKRPIYELYRQEGIKLDLADYTKQEGSPDRYLIADNVVSCKLTFIVIYEKKEEEKKEQTPAVTQPAKEPQEKKEQEKKPTYEQKEFKDWVTGKEEKDIRTQVKLPTEVLMELTLTNQQDTRERSFAFRVPIATTFQEVPIQVPPRIPGGSQATPGTQDKKAQTPEINPKEQEKKETLAQGANRIMQTLRKQFGQA